MIRLQELIDYLDGLLMPVPIKDSCYNGLQVEGKRDVAKIATAVSASLATIEKAVDWGADVLIVHHGLFWTRDLPLLVRSMRQKVGALVAADLSLLAYHLPLDMHQEVGNNYAAARDLGLTDLEPFGEFDGLKIGVKGKLPGLSIDAWLGKLEKYYEHKAFAALGGAQEIRTAAIVSGSGQRAITQAVQQGIDCLITGSFDEPMWHTAHEEKVHFIALGHSNTERVGPIALATYLARTLNVPTRFIDVQNPF